MSNSRKILRKKNFNGTHVRLVCICGENRDSNKTRHNKQICMLLVNRCNISVNHLTLNRTYRIPLYSNFLISVHFMFIYSLTLTLASAVSAHTHSTNTDVRRTESIHIVYFQRCVYCIHHAGCCCHRLWLTTCGFSEA